MPTTIKGHAACPECGSTQPAKHDGRKYFINCAECRTMTSYQSKAAQQRLLGKLSPIESEATSTETTTPEPKPYKPVRASDSVFSNLTDLF